MFSVIMPACSILSQICIARTLDQRYGWQILRLGTSADAQKWEKQFEQSHDSKQKRKGISNKKCRAGDIGRAELCIIHMQVPLSSEASIKRRLAWSSLVHLLSPNLVIPDSNITQFQSKVHNHHKRKRYLNQSTVGHPWMEICCWCSDAHQIMKDDYSLGSCFKLL